jgi:molybdate transport system permease protein
MNLIAIALTLRLAVLSTAILLVAGLPLAYWIATTRMRFRFLVEALVALPIVLPPSVVGFYLLVTLGGRSPLGKAILDLTGQTLPFTFKGILIGAVIFNFPFAVRPFTSAFSGVERKLVEASWCLGVSRLKTFFCVVLPLAWPGILTGLVLAFAHTVGEFGVVLMVGGNIPGVTQTISTVIYDDVQALNYAAANQTAALLLGFAFVTLCLMYALQKRILAI